MRHTAKKSRQLKPPAKRPSEPPAGKIVPIAGTTRRPWQIAVVCFVLATTTVFSYGGVWNNNFVRLDDDIYVAHNRQVHQGVTAQSIEWAFTTFCNGHWHPLTWIFHMVDWKLYGANPRGHHLTNVCLHAANAVLLFLLLLYMTGFIWRSAMVAFLFALHPAHVESVAWIAELKDVLCALFFFATLLAYAWYVRRPTWARFIWVVCGFACALMSKSMAVTLPLVLVLLDFWPLRRVEFTRQAPVPATSLGKLCAEKWLLFLMAAIASVLAFLAQRATGGLATLQGLPLWVRLCNTAISYCRYVWIMVWPDPLRVYYYHETHNISVLAAVLSAIALVLVTYVCWRIRKERPYCLIGWLWFLITLVPVIGIVQAGGQAMAERYTYLPYVGLFIAVVWLAGEAIAEFQEIRVVTQALAVAVIVACAVKTDAQVKVWKDSMMLFNHVLTIDPRGDLPNLGLGIEYFRQEKLADAQEYFDRALSYNPHSPLALSYSAHCLMVSCVPNEPRNLPLARQRLEEALRIAPGDPDALSNMALWSYDDGRMNDAEMYSREAIDADPDFVPAHLYLGSALQVQDKLAEAAQEYRLVLDLEPDSYDAHYNLGIVLIRQGLTEEALEEFRLSVAIKPDQAEPHSQMGWIYMRSHRLPEAIREYTQALSFDPTNAGLHSNLGVALFQLGDYERAVGQFRVALQINPADADARNNLNIAQSRIKSK